MNVTVVPCNLTKTFEIYGEECWRYLVWSPAQIVCLHQLILSLRLRSACSKDGQTFLITKHKRGSTGRNSLGKRVQLHSSLSRLQERQSARYHSVIAFTMLHSFMLHPIIHWSPVLVTRNPIFRFMRFIPGVRVIAGIDIILGYDTLAYQDHQHLSTAEKWTSMTALSLLEYPTWLDMGYYPRGHRSGGSVTRCKA